MEIVGYRALEPFTTKDGPTIREYIHSPAQSLAEATLLPGQSTRRDYRASSEVMLVATLRVHPEGAGPPALTW